MVTDQGHGMQGRARGPGGLSSSAAECPTPADRRQLWLDVIAAALEAHLLDQENDGAGVLAAIDRLLSRLAVAEAALPPTGSKVSAEAPS